MRTYSTKEILIKCEISHTTLYRWIKSGMPIVRTDPYIFDGKAIEWIREKRSEYYSIFKQKSSGEDE